MSFSLTSSNVQLKNGRLLVADCMRRDGTEQRSEIKLHEHLGNDEGRFVVGGRNFILSARKVRLENSSLLSAELASSDRQWFPDSINLDAFIGNDNGRLVASGNYDQNCLRPAAHHPQQVDDPETTRPQTDRSTTPTASAIQCHLCEDWPRMHGQKRVSTIPQITLAALKSVSRNKGCPTCKLARRLIKQMVPDLAGRREVKQESIMLQLYPNNSQDLPTMKIRFLTRSGEKVVWDLVMHSNQGEENLSRYYNSVPPQRLLTGDSTSQQSLQRAQRWFNTCVKQHAECPSSRTAKLPARILDIGLDSEDSVRLKTTSGEHETYACLSHCWGPTQTLTLTERNHDDMHFHIPWDSLQKTYTDAITLCRLLGIRYIWIDALCIVQDSAEDWERESAKMHSYYGGCFVCIAATSAPDHDGGCRARSLRLRHEGTDEEGQPYSVYVRPKVPHIMHSDAFPHAQYFPLLTRAWVYQERRLSPRVLHVTDMELFFECSTSAVCECGGSGPQSFLTTSSWTKANEAYFASQRDLSEIEEGAFRAEHEWRSYVCAYSKLGITKQSDRLPALSGLAQVSRPHREAHGLPTGRYLAGCWEGSLVNDMAWAVGPELRRLERTGSGFQLPGLPLIPNTYRTAAQPKPEQPIAPSWSWASVMDPVVYPPFGYPDHECQVHGAFVEPNSGDPHGSVEGGFLILWAQLLPTRWKWRSSWRGRYAWLEDVTVRQYWGLGNVRGMMWWRDWADGPVHRLDESQELHLMPLAAKTVLGRTEAAEFSSWLNPGVTVTETAYLVLRLIDGDADPAVYERVGWASYSGTSGSGPELKGRKKGTLKLI